MSTPMSDVKFGSWNAPESPVNIEYSLVVIDEIRHEVAEGYQRLSRGGIEVGGVLYGVRDGRTIRITAMRPIACEHARGPGFVFSDKDRITLNEQLARDKDDPQLNGLISLGWYLSHTRSEIVLNEPDLEIFTIFFPAPWQVTMVVRPGRGGSMRAGFFVRQEDGTVKGDSSYAEFNFPDRMAGILDRTPHERPMRDRSERRLPSTFRLDAPTSEAVESETVDPAAQLPGPELVRLPPRRKKWPWLVAWALLVIVASVAGLRYWMMSSVSEPISLSVVEREGQLQIEWNHSAKPVTGAASGSLEITDGAEPRTIQLTKTDLAAGKFTYARKTGDIEVRMTVQDAGGSKTQEASRFLGRAPNAPKSAAEISGAQDRKDELEAEVDRLHRENRAQANKIQQLERTLRILQTRLGIVEPEKP